MPVSAETLDRTAAIKPIFGIVFSPVNQQLLVAEFLATPDRGQQTRYVVTANVDHIVQLQDNRDLQLAYEHAWRRTIDGTPIYLYARARGLKIDKVAGADLFEATMHRLSPDVQRPYFICADQQVADGLIHHLVGRGYRVEDIGIEIPPYGFEKNTEYSDAMAGRIRQHRTTHLFFGVGCPKSETWIYRYRDQLGDIYACAVGAALAFQAGVLARAPLFIQKIGMEWLWRSFQEPKRLLKRYFLHSWAFLAIVRNDLT